jgi:hypothetical protein
MRYACNIEDEAITASIFKLRPGHWLRWKDGVVTTAPYWRHPILYLPPGTKTS